MEREKIRKAFISNRLAVILCAAANSRLGMTAYFGVKDDGRVVGVRIRKEEVPRLFLTFLYIFLFYFYFFYIGGLL